MATTWKAPTWRMPNDKNQSKFESYSIDFNGMDPLNCGNSDTLNIASSNYSISTWVKYTTPNNQVVCEKGSNNQLALQIGGTGFNGYIAWIGGADYVVRSASPINDGNWHHICCVAYGSSSILYIDGQISATGGSKTQVTNTSNFMIGGRGTSYGFTGSMSQLCLFDYDLSSAQVSSLYNSGSPINPMTLKPAPIAYYPLGGNASTGGDSSNTLSVPNVAVPDASVFNFDGSSNFIELNSVQNLTGEFSISIWVKPDGLTYSQAVLGDTAFDWIRLNSANEITFRINSGSGSTDENFNAIAGKSLVSNVWQHLFFYRDSSNNIRVYRNGSLFSNDINTNSDTFKIGKIGSRTGVYYTGEISNVAIWNSDQSSQISNIYNSGVPATTYTNTPTAWYKLNQSANWEADTVGDWQIPDAVSAYPQSFDFDGNDDFVSTNFNVDNYTNLTYSVWVNPTSLNQRGGLASLSSVNNFVTAFWDGSGGRFYVYIGNVLSQITGIWSGSKFGTLGQEKWLHIAVVYDGSGATDADRLKVYADGDYVAFNSLGSIPTSIPSGGGDLIIGKWTTAEYDGKMSNVMLFDSSLPATGTDSVETLYNNGVPLTTAIVTDNLKAWYKLDNNDRFQGDWRNIDYAENLNYTKALSRIGPDNGITSAGNGDRVNCGNNSSLQITGAMSISIWFRVNTISPAHAYNFVMGRARFRTEAAADACWSLLLKGVSYGAPAHFRLQLSDGTTKTIYDITETTNGDFFSDRWQNLIITYDGTTDANSIKAYLNGELHQQFTSSQASINNIAARNLTFYDNDVYQYGDPTYTGALSNCAIWNKKLESSDIASIWNNGSPALTMPSESELQGWWKFSDGTYNSGNTSWSFPDSSQNSNTGETYTFTSSATAFDANSMSDNNVQAGTGISSGMTEQNLVNNNVSALNGESLGMDTSNLVTSTLTRQVPYNSYSLNFNGVDESVSVGTGDILTGIYSLSMWMRRTATSGGDFYQGMFSKDDGSSNRCFNNYIQQNNGQLKMWQSSDGSSLNVTQTTINAIADTNWHHVVFINPGSSANCQIFIDGAEATYANQYTGIDSIHSSTVANLLAGHAVASNYQFLGMLNNVSIFNKVLTSTEIVKLYNSGVPGDLSSFNPQPSYWWSLGSDSYYDGNDWICPDLIGSTNGTSVSMDSDELVGNAPKSTANGTSTNMTIDANLTGSAPNSSNNSFSVNMSFDDRETDVPS